MKKCFFIIFFLIMMPFFSHSDQTIKDPNVSGTFYDSNPKRLTDQIKGFINAADIAPFEGFVGIIISPHAGYVYSGGVAAYSFKFASQNTYSSIIILGPSHYYDFNGVQILDRDGYRTALGVAPVDRALAEKLIAQGSTIKPAEDYDIQAFEREHSVEVEIPFIQTVFPKAKIVPMVMGRMNADSLAEFVRTLREVIGEREDILIVISSDMSHFHDDATARKLDLKAAETIQTLDPNTIWNAQQAGLTEIDGILPIMSAVLYANASGLKNTEFLKYAHSGEVTGDMSRVVGYTSIAFTKEKVQKGSTVSALTLDQKRRLIQIARETVETYIRDGKTLEFKEKDPRLKEKEGAFVTLHKHGELRGCIGNIIGQGPLYKTVRDMSISSAVSDPRFKAVTKEELDQIDIEVSVLSKPWRIKDVKEIELGKHGVIISRGRYNRGVFLPQVADETGWTKEQFLTSLCVHKAGLEPDAWKDPDTVIEIFSAEVFSEEDVK